MHYFSLKQIPHFRQWLAGLQGLFIMLIVGTDRGWVCPFMGRLIDENPPFVATKEQISWLASLGSLTQPLGNLVGALTNNYFGCKTSLHFFAAAYYLAAYICLMCATSIEHVYLTQICCGIGLGSLKSLVHLYISEIASDNMRGLLINMVMQGFLVGIVVGNFLGAYLQPWIYAATYMVFITIYVLTFFFFPETPTRLLQQNKPDKALESLKWYQEDVNAEAKLKELEDFLKSKPKLNFKKSLKDLMTPLNRRVMFILFATYGLLQFSGMLTVLQYSEIIFKEGGVNVLPTAVLVIVMGVMGIPGCWIGMYTSERFGRTVMLCFSCVVFSIALVGLAVNFQLADLGYDTSHIQWIIIVSALLFRLSLSIGVTGVPQILLSEFLAPNVKNVGSCVCNLFSSLCAFLSNKNFQVMVDTLTYKNVFFLFAALTLIMGISIRIYVPETKGMSLPKIQEMLEERFLNKNTKLSKTEKTCSINA